MACFPVYLCLFFFESSSNKRPVKTLLNILFLIDMLAFFVKTVNNNSYYMKSLDY